MPTDPFAYKVVDAILANLQTRKGIGDALDEIEDDVEVMDELRLTLVGIVEREMEGWGP